MNAAEYIETERLILRRPRPADAQAIFDRYASDPEVTRYLGWPRHQSIEQTRAFLHFSDNAWAEWPGGPYVIELRASRVILGGAGFGFETPFRAAVGYVLASDSWGRGYATEALRVLTDISPEIGIHRLHADCHPEHRASSRVLEKCDFVLEGVHRRHAAFPNIGTTGPSDVLCYTRVFG